MKSLNNERFKEMRKALKLSQQNLADTFGLKQGSISDIERGRTNDLSSSMKKGLQEKFNLNIDYLYNLSDEIFINAPEVNPLHISKVTEAIIENQEIPLYDIEVTAGVVSLFKDPQSTTPIDTIKIPNMPKCDGAMTITGDSMYPLVKSGDIVFYKAIQDIPESIFYGNMYIVSLNIEGDELVMLKYIQKGKDEEHLLLVSENRHHADKEIHIKYINGIALVKGNVRFNFTT